MALPKTLDLSAIHSNELDFYQALLGSALSIKEQVGDWHITNESMYGLTDEQHAILLLKDPDFLTWQEADELENQFEWHKKNDTHREYKGG